MTKKGNFYSTDLRQIICILVFQGCHNKVPTLGGLNKRNELSHNSGGWRSEVMILAG